MRIHSSLDILLVILETMFFVYFSVFRAVCLFYFEFNVIFIDFYNICLTALREKHKALQWLLLPGIGLSVSCTWKV